MKIKLPLVSALTLLLFSLQSQTISLVKDLNNSTYFVHRDPWEVTALDSIVIFAGYDEATGMEIWRSNGTEAGTWPPGNLIFFNGSDTTGNNELWKTDGTAAGTLPVKEIRPGKEGSIPGNFSYLGDLLLFTTDDGTHGRELWKTDGTAEGTILIKVTIQPPTVQAPTKLETKVFLSGQKSWRRA
jgi:ELWxxDGT repeat protein